MIKNIEVRDSRFKTVEGVHAKMKLSDAEKIYAKGRKIPKCEMELREFAEFINQPKGSDVRITQSCQIFV